MKAPASSILAAAVALATAALLGDAVVVRAQAGVNRSTAADADLKAKALRQKRLAERFARDARVPTIFNRQGKQLATVGEPAIYNRLVFSPDRKRLAVIIRDLEAENADLWVLGIGTAERVRITSSQRRELVTGVVWSPDSRRLAYVALRGGYEALYRKALSGDGSEELLYRHPGANMILSDWSMDGRFLSFAISDLSGGVLYTLPLDRGGEAKPIEVLRSTTQLRAPTLSPDSHFVAYGAADSGKTDLFVRSFDSSMSVPSQESWGVFANVRAGAQWRRDGKEILIIAGDRRIMAASVTTAPTFTFGPPKLLFRMSEAVTVTAVTTSISEDGEWVVIAVPQNPVLQQITVLDRQGNTVRKVGQPGTYADASFSPDGQRVAVRRIVPDTGFQDIWVFDITSGKGIPVTSDAFGDVSVAWSPDGKRIAYVSTRGTFSRIYQKAATGIGAEEALYQYTPGGSLRLNDWSDDGSLITFHDGCLGVLHVLPLRAGQEVRDRRAIEWLRDEYNVALARFSPDGRFIAYLANDGKTPEEINSDIFEVYVRPFDPAVSDVSNGPTKPTQVSTTGAQGMIVWRQDGREVFYLSANREVMAVDVTTSPTFQSGPPRRLFTLPGPVVGGPEEWRSVSRDGQRFVFTVNVPAPVSAR